MSSGENDSIYDSIYYNTNKQGTNEKMLEYTSVNFNREKEILEIIVHIKSFYSVLPLMQISRLLDQD